jgi:hypothetical protein
MDNATRQDVAKKKNCVSDDAAPSAVCVRKTVADELADVWIRKQEPKSQHPDIVNFLYYTHPYM